MSTSFEPTARAGVSQRGVSRHGGQLRIGRKALLVAAALVCAAAPALAYSSDAAARSSRVDYAWQANGTGATTLTIAPGQTVTFSYPAGTEDPQRRTSRARSRRCAGAAARAAAAGLEGTCTFDAPGTLPVRLRHPPGDEGHGRRRGADADADATPTPTATADADAHARRRPPTPDPGGRTPTTTHAADAPSKVKLASRQKGTRVRGHASTSRRPASRLEVTRDASGKRKRVGTLGQDVGRGGHRHVLGRARRARPAGAAEPSAASKLDRAGRADPAGRQEADAATRDRRRLASEGCAASSSCSPPASPLSACGETPTPATEPRVKLKLDAPDNGGSTRDDHVAVRGTVTPADAAVQVMGDDAQVDGGRVHRRRRARSPGGNVIDVTATSPGRRPATDARARHARHARRRAGRRRQVARRRGRRARRRSA